MYYKIENDIMEETTIEDWEKKQDGVALFTSTDWEQAVKIRASYLLEQNRDNIRFCKLESYADFLFGTFHIPRKREKSQNISFAFYILENKLIFIDDTGLVKKSIERITSGKLRKGYTVERFLYDFLVSLIEEDVVYLAEIEKDITKMEEAILKREVEDFNYRMLGLKKEISRMYRYYSQLTDLGESLFDNEMDFFGKDDIATFRIFADRVARLQGETQVLREYAMQVQEVYQSEIGIRQNDVMKVLTMVTIIFLPLTLLVGWYGMNFTHMPELNWIYGYPMVIVLSIIIVSICLWIFKKKM
ncbi:magnesium transporter CorA family protein [Aminipila terrae]|uniref:Cobalt transporter n=1 Tax=Aminipila terrae TaxID=2697030 RepID=A0A6P1MJ37_9FIRM|nr:CorA family divalent cation transporter [Aminipila terrae]QHI71616.1 cobalt transporter [Aminipila terrae]